MKRDLLRVPREDREGGFAQLALELARWLDAAGRDFSASPRDIAAIAGQLRGVLETLARKQEPAAVLDPVDELAKRRERRLGRDAAAADD